jgi:hypothetical protein
LKVEAFKRTSLEALVRNEDRSVIFSERKMNPTLKTLCKKGLYP